MFLKNGRFGPYIQYEIIPEVNEEPIKKKKVKKKKIKKKITILKIFQFLKALN